LRKAAGISQAELANRMGVDRAYVSGLELGQRNPTIVTLWHIAKALDLDFREIFGSPQSKPLSPKRIGLKVGAKKRSFPATRRP
jgi:transcriptional regulator with XRE-family HTH domain